MAETIWGTGRRKTSVARVMMAPGSGKIEVNGKPHDEYFKNYQDHQRAIQPLLLTENLGKFDIVARVHGGGPTGQSGALVLGIARALRLHNETLDETLRNAGYLTRDGRMKERKKPGQRGARRKFQFSKR